MSSLAGQPVLTIAGLDVSYRSGRSWIKRRAATVSAVDGVDLTIGPGQTHALVGESGSGKSSVARAVVGLVKASGGSIEIDGEAVDPRRAQRSRHFRQSLQMVFQDPFTSLDPRMAVGEQVLEPLIISGDLTRREGERRAAELLDAVGIGTSASQRLPHQFSGGQRQRIVIARALALRPKVVICDEPVSALDVSIQAQVINLLQELQQIYGLSYLLITHDLAVVRSVAHSVSIMYMGRIVEHGSTEAIYSKAVHPYTRALLSAIRIPVPRLERRRERIVLSGEMPSASDPPSGCRFRTRCPLALAVCETDPPELRSGDGLSTAVACHRSGEIRDGSSASMSSLMREGSTDAQ